MKAVKVISAMAGVVGLGLVGSAHAFYVSGYIKGFSVGANGVFGTLIQLVDVTFPEACNGNNNNVIAKGSDSNYKEFVATLLAAKVSGKKVGIQTSACGVGDNYFPIKEVQIQ